MLISNVLPVTAIVADNEPPIVEIDGKYYQVSSMVADTMTNNPPVYSGSTDVDSDEYKAANAKGMFKTPGGDGRVWTDKSVEIASDNKSFDVTLSTVGQTYESKNAITIQNRADVLFILDDTSSMTTQDVLISGSDYEYRYQALVNAANQAIDIIMKANPENRIEIDLFSRNDTDSGIGGLRVLMPLDSYTPGSYSGTGENKIGQYIQASGSGSSYNIGTVSGLKQNGSDYSKSFKNVQGTYTQYSTYKAINHVIDEINEEISQGKMASEKTIPYVFLFTDGIATNCDYTLDFVNPTTLVSGNNKQKPQDYPDMHIKLVPTAIMTAAYWKDQLSKAYYDYNGISGSDPSVETRFFSVGLAGSGDTYSFTEMDNAMLAPKLLLDTYTEGDTELWNSSSTSRSLKDRMLEIGSELAEDVRDQIVEEILPVNIAKYPDLGLEAYSPANGNEFIYTTDTYYYKAGQVSELNNAFSDLAKNVQEETKPRIIPVEEQTTGQALGGVQLIDHLGTGMKVNLPDALVAKIGTSYTFEMRKVVLDSDDEDLVAKYVYSINNKQMVVEITKDNSNNQTLTWTVPAGLLPLFEYDKTQNKYNDAKHLELTYNVQIDEDFKNVESHGLTFYSNYFDSSTESNPDKDGSAVGIYEPKLDNPHFYNTEGEAPAGGSYPINDRFYDSVNKKPIRIEATKAVTGGGETKTATSAGIADFSQTIDGAITDHHVMYNYLGNNGIISLTEIPSINIPVEKEWLDDDNSRTTRPSSITVRLYAGEEAAKDIFGGDVAPIVLNSENDWAGEFKALPTQDDGGKTINYTVKEDPVTNYDEPKIESDGNGGYVITNSLLIDLSVSKIWNDNGDESKKRPSPDSVFIQLYANGSLVADSQVELNNSNKYTYKYEDLPLYNGTTKIVYSIKELNGSGQAVENGNKYNTDYVVLYGTTDDGNTLTATNALVTSIPVEKVWDDNNNQDGKRLTSMKVQLYADEAAQGSAVELNIDNEFKHTYENLPVYNGTTKIAYSVKELDPSNNPIADKGKYNNDYTEVTYATDSIGKVTITNKHIPEVTSVDVTKVWDDASNQDGKRPESVVYKLYKTVNSVVSEVLDGTGNPVTATLNETDPASDTWTYKFENLPVYENGNKITYTIKELDPSKDPINNNGSYNSDYDVVTYSDDYLSVTNKHTPEEITIQGKKNWDDSDYWDEDEGKWIGSYARPESIIIKIMDGTTEVDRITVTASTVDATDDDVWHWTSKSLPKYRDGDEIEYVVVEVTPDGYESKVTKYDVENTPKQADNDTPVTLTVNKMVTGTNYGLNDVEFTLTDVDSEKKETAVYTTANDGTATIEFTKAGNYTLKETWAPEGYDMDPNTYEIKVTRSDLVSVTLKEGVWEWLYNLLFTDDTKGILDPTTNTLTIYDRALVEIPVEKVWDDYNNLDKVRPESVTVNLYADGVLLKEVNINGILAEDGNMVLSKENEWFSVFTDLDKYDRNSIDAKEIKYEVKEIVPAKYAVSYSGDINTKIIIKNTHKPITPPPYIPPNTGLK